MQDVAATLAAGGLQPFAGVPGRFTMQPRFLDSADPTKALFSGVGELEVQGQYLYVTDQYNYRVRRVDLVTGAVSTVLGSGSSVGWSTNTNALLATCGRFAGLGVTADGLHLYVAMQNSNMVRYSAPVVYAHRVAEELQWWH